MSAIDITQPIELSDGRLMTIIGTVQPWGVAANNDMAVRLKCADGSAVFGDDERNERWFYIANGRHVHGRGYVRNRVLSFSDRVRYDNGDPSHKWAGWTGTITDYGSETCQVLWDRGTKHNATATTKNLKRITDTMIDTTKKLEAFSDMAKGEVTFVTETSDGNIMIDIPSDSRAFSQGWVIFNKSGEFVRSKDGMGKALRLRNVQVEEVRYYSLDRGGAFSGPYTYNPTGFGRGKLKVTLTNGVITASEIIS